MKTSQDENRNNFTLNPFAFPTETNVRFIMLALALAVLAVTPRATIFAMQFILNPEGAIQNNFNSSGSQFQATTGSTVVELALETARNFALPASFLTVVFLIALVLYLRHPAHIRRRDKLTQLSPNDEGEIQDEIERLVSLTGVPGKTEIVYGPIAFSQEAQAFGLPNNYVLRLDEGLFSLYDGYPEKTRALILHELAHIANRDIWRTYLALAFRLPVILLAGAPMILAIGALFVRNLLFSLQVSGASVGIGRQIVGFLVSAGILTIWYGGLLVLFAYILASLLRLREIYADWRVVLWGAGEHLRNILQINAARQEPKSGRKLFRLHPTAQDRLAVLQDPLRLFKGRLHYPLVVGILLAFIYGGVIQFFNPLSEILAAMILAVGNASLDLSSWLFPFAIAMSLGGNAMLVLGYLVPILGVSYFVAGTVGLQVQREVGAELITDPRGCSGFLRLGLFSAMLAIGVELGFLIAPLSINSPLNVFIVGEVPNPWLLLLLVPWLFVLFGASWLGLFYMRAFSNLILGSHAGSSRPKWKQRVLTLGTTLQIGLWYFPLLVARRLIIYQEFEAQFLITYFIVGSIMAVIFTALMFFGTWIIAQVRLSKRPRRCHACGKDSQKQRTIGQKCEHCDEHLAPWLMTVPQPLQ